ncbi:hypothetical protein HPP92_018381 [Vanilla planifolia]|uniref:Gamma-tubulin complex component n=1 Tax=Vanilla planifolia TaxID=51239 RepID=A0A835Q9T1_VANPL|nr:hypothetical protein HPP92_018381 [Vanilla planifolia]
MESNLATRWNLRRPYLTVVVLRIFIGSYPVSVQDYQAMVAQLEHQFRLGRLSVQGFGSFARWVYEGIIDDPYGEFFIAENKSLQKESLTLDYDAKYWQQRYSLKDGIPSFLAGAAETILITGKYLNVMRVWTQFSGSLRKTQNYLSFGSNHHYLECLKVAYDFTSCELLNLIKEKMMPSFLLDSMALLESCGPWKRYFLLEQSLLDIALRSTAAASDPCHEELTCCVERVPLLKKLSMLKDLEAPFLLQIYLLWKLMIRENHYITGLETFCLSYKVQWLSRLSYQKALTKYQLIFQLLFHCKHVERQLCVAWQVHQMIQLYDLFLQKCLKECLLLLPQLVKLLVPSIYIPDVDGEEDTYAFSMGKSKTRSSRKFEEEFNSELHSLQPILSYGSQTEPYLTISPNAFWVQVMISEIT